MSICILLFENDIFVVIVFFGFVVLRNFVYESLVICARESYRSSFGDRA